jgi:hypothetical protein
LFTLARDTGRPSARQLARELSLAELVEWEAFYEVDGLLQREMASGKGPAEALRVVQLMIEIHAEAEAKRRAQGRREN